MRALLRRPFFAATTLVLFAARAVPGATSRDSTPQAAVSALVEEYRSGDADAAIRGMAAIDEDRLRKLVREKPESKDPWQLAALALLHGEAAFLVDMIDESGLWSSRRGNHGRRESELMRTYVCRPAEVEEDAALRDLCRRWSEIRGSDDVSRLFPDDAAVLMRQAIAKSPAHRISPPRFRLGEFPTGAPSSSSHYDCGVPTEGRCNDYWYEAGRLFAKVLEIDPTSAEARLRRGRVLLYVDQQDEALRELLRAAADARAEQDQSSLYLAELLLGHLHERGNRPDRAVVHYRAAHAAGPAFPVAAIALARLEVLAGRPTEAAAALTRALSAEAGKDGTQGPDPWRTFFRTVDWRSTAAGLAALRTAVRR